MPTRWAPWPEKSKATLVITNFYRLLNGRWIGKLQGGVEIIFNRVESLHEEKLFHPLHGDFCDSETRCGHLSNRQQFG
jgi:hypothetical protein